MSENQLERILQLTVLDLGLGIAGFKAMLVISCAAYI